ncbi:hypothetical protein Sango_1880400 [Sesamum angolense]|uniref:DDE Tnp4 domain-containing protein n=1 Tax=Sesamum angolense TaxID=2727404 RepID=A0AAE1WJ21_9LAMI|nr:hypothetical protein Sango_1880400 [Sesamum angolense]
MNQTATQSHLLLAGPILHDTRFSLAVGSSSGDEETDSSNMSSNEEKHFMLLYEVLRPSYFRTKQPQHTSSLQGSDWVSKLMSVFTYVMARWEGSANDAHVFMDCLNNNRNFPWPPDGKYYLEDSAYPNFTGFLASY